MWLVSSRSVLSHGDAPSEWLAVISLTPLGTRWEGYRPGASMFSADPTPEYFFRAHLLVSDYESHWLCLAGLSVY